MTNKLEMYRCEMCGNLVQVVLEGEGELVCCNQPMNLLTPKGVDFDGVEKHVPVFEIFDNCSQIKVGNMPHPMNEDHYIMFIESISHDKKNVHLQYLCPGMEPKIILENKIGKTYAREFCNIHGLWEAESD